MSNLGRVVGIKAFDFYDAMNMANYLEERIDSGKYTEEEFWLYITYSKNGLSGLTKTYDNFDQHQAIDRLRFKEEFSW